ncbi:hypothetical protein K8I85_15790 [bacterium]|nr:hypothetical protein [bacterium]
MRRFVILATAASFASGCLHDGPQYHYSWASVDSLAVTAPFPGEVELTVFGHLPAPCYEPAAPVVTRGVHRVFVSMHSRIERGYLCLDGVAPYGMPVAIDGVPPGRTTIVVSGHSALDSVVVDVPR